MRDYTDITLLLDRSGSMEAYRDKTIDACNEFIRGQKAAGDNACLSLVQFDNAYEPNYQAVPIAQVQFLNRDTYQPRGTTAYLDALCRSIDATGSRLAAMPEASRPDKVVFVIQTDGLENASRTFNRSDCRSRIERQRKLYNWQVLFLSCDEAALKDAVDIGIPAVVVAGYADGATLPMAASYTTSNLANYRKSGDVTALNFTKQQRKDMTDGDHNTTTTTNTAGTPSGS